MRARFFCESCGAAVAARADRCPGCGKVFAAVKCPRCGFEGRHWDFVRGCKVCGYLAPEEPLGAPERRRARPEVPLTRGLAFILGGLLLVLLIVLLIVLASRR